MSSSLANTRAGYRINMLYVTGGSLLWKWQSYSRKWVRQIELSAFDVLLHILQCGQKESLAQRFKQSQSTRKRNGEAILKSNMANYLISQINCSFSGGWCGKYSTRTVNTSVQTAEARVNVSHGFPHKHVLLLKQTGLIRFHQLLLYSVCTFSLFEALVFSSVLLWRNKKKNHKE